MGVTVIEHPLLRERLTRLRDVSSPTATFREALHDVARLMCFEVTRDLEVETVPVDTPLTRTDGHRLARPAVLVPILRAGIGMLEGFLDILSDAAIGHVGLYRDEETHRPQWYYFKMPPHLSDAEVILLDPMLATGNSAADAADRLREEGAERIRFVSLLAAPEGIATFERRHPEIPVFTGAIDDRLNERAYIVPGLGDAGDRYFGT